MYLQKEKHKDLTDYNYLLEDHTELYDLDKKEPVQACHLSRFQTLKINYNLMQFSAKLINKE